MSTERSVYFPDAHTPAEWRAMARGNRQEAHDSFERCDTDGFLSQWANQTMAGLYEFLAKLAEGDGTWVFRKLADLDDNLLDAREVHTRYGYAWAINTDHGTVWFHESEARDPKVRAANNARKGYKFLAVRQPAVAMLSNGLTPTPFAAPRKDTTGVVLGDWIDSQE